MVSKEKINDDMGFIVKDNENGNEIKKKTDVSFLSSKDSCDKAIESRETELDSDLKATVKGTGIIFIGLIIGNIFGLIGTILVARFYSVGEYGLYGLAVFIISFFIGISALGVIEGCPRYVSYYRGKKDERKIKGIINTSLLTVGISSTIFAILLFFLSDFIANKIFGIEELASIIKVIVIALPFWAIIRVIIGIFRGFESVKENVYLSNFTLPFVKISFFATVILLGFSFDYIIVAYSMSVIITFFVSIFYLTKRLPENIKRIKKTSLQTRTLLSFSWPLAFSGLGWHLISGADKLMLGILATEVEIGLYTSAVSLAHYLTLFLATIIFIYQPIASRLLAENRADKIKRNYQVLTKWLFTLTFPFIIILLLFPGTVISIIFGGKYLLATNALRLLAIAYFIHTFLGPNGATITILGKTKMIMVFTLFGGCINIVLNYFLIPLFGIEGAAFSTMTSLILINILNGGYLYKISKIHPIRKNFILPVFLSIGFLAVVYYFITYFYLENLSLPYKILICLIVIIFYFVIMLISKSYDKEDLQLLLLFEKRTGIRFNNLRKIIKKFI